MGIALIERKNLLGLWILRLIRGGFISHFIATETDHAKSLPIASILARVQHFEVSSRYTEVTRGLISLLNQTKKKKS